MDRWKTGEFLWCGSFMNVSNCVSPLRDAFVRPDDGGLDVDGVVTHPSQLHGLFQGADHVQSVVSFCTHSQQFQLTRRCLSNCCSRPPEGALQSSAGVFQPCGPAPSQPMTHVLTSTGVRQLGSAEEAQVSSPSPDSLCVPEAESGTEVVRL